MRVNREALKLHAVYYRSNENYYHYYKSHETESCIDFISYTTGSCTKMLSISANCLVWQHQSGCGSPPLSLGFPLGVGGWWLPGIF